MAIGAQRPARQRPVPVSGITRSTSPGRFLAALHDQWLAHRARAKWRGEIAALDDRILRDVGLSRAEASAAFPPGKPAAESTFPPHYHRGLVKLAHHIEA